LKKKWKYIHKEEGAVLQGDWEGPEDVTVDMDLKKKDERSSHILDATSREEYFERARALAPYEYWLQYQKIVQFADVHYPVEIPKYQPNSIRFPFTTPEMDRWVRDEFPKKDRPKTLVLWGPSKLGKTEWARALNHIIAARNGITDPDLIREFLIFLVILLVDFFDLADHVFMANQFNASKVNESASYIVLDDIDIGFFPSYKMFLGGQKEFEVTDKYVRKLTLKWGKPCIWLSNDNPCLNPKVDAAWLHANCVFVNLEDKLYEDEVEIQDPVERWRSESLEYADLPSNLSQLMREAQKTPPVYLEDRPFTNRNGTVM